MTSGTLVIDVDACKGCELCIDACPPHVLEYLGAQATVTLPFYDSISYSEGSLNTVGSPTWVAGNGTTFEIAVSNSAALTAPEAEPKELPSPLGHLAKQDV